MGRKHENDVEFAMINVSLKLLVNRQCDTCTSWHMSNTQAVVVLFTNTSHVDQFESQNCSSLINYHPHIYFRVHGQMRHLILSKSLFSNCVFILFPSHFPVPNKYIKINMSILLYISTYIQNFEKCQRNRAICFVSI